MAAPRTWGKNGNTLKQEPKKLTHAVELALTFTNKGRTRVRLYNIQVGLNTMRPPDKAQFDQGDGHLHLTRVHTSGNLVPTFEVRGKTIDETSFYYVEPGVSQSITYLCLISEPRELLQAFAMFSLEQKRLFPKKFRSPKGLYPHTAARTFPLRALNTIEANADA